jgi:hypothetical protein
VWEKGVGALLQEHAKERNGDMVTRRDLLRMMGMGAAGKAESAGVVEEMSRLIREGWKSVRP